MYIITKSNFTSLIRVIAWKKAENGNNTLVMAIGIILEWFGNLWVISMVESPHRGIIILTTVKACGYRMQLKSRHVKLYLYELPVPDAKKDIP